MVVCLVVEEDKKHKAILGKERKRKKTNKGKAKEEQQDEGGEEGEEEGDGTSGRRFLLIQRPKSGLLASLWEFPTVPVQQECEREKCKEEMATYLEEAASLQEGRREERRKKQVEQEEGGGGAGEGGKGKLGPEALVGRMEHVGETEFLFSHIRQRMVVLSLTISSRRSVGIDDTQVVRLARVFA